jgi:uncharacterized delta-60 repeat protein
VAEARLGKCFLKCFFIFNSYVIIKLRRILFFKMPNSFQLQIFFEKIKHRFLVDKIYLYLAIGFLVLVFGATFFYLFLRPEPLPEIPRLPSTPLQKGLLGYWGFDEKGGQFLFNAQNRKEREMRLGKEENGDESEPLRVKGLKNRALQFDGKDDYAILIQDPVFETKKEVTIEGWFRVLGKSTSSPSPLWLPGFSWRRQIVLKNPERKMDLKQIQIPLEIDTKTLVAQQKMKEGCEDMRFTDSDETTLLDFWVESGCNTEKTKVWVKIPYLKPQSEKTLYFYYGNKKAEGMSSFQKTMETTPLEWWRYPGEKEDNEFKELKSMVLLPDNYLLAVGSVSLENNDLAWYRQNFSPQGRASGSWQENVSPGPDEINDVAVNSKGVIVMAGYDSLPGNSQWRVKRMAFGGGEESWTYNKNFSPGSDEAKAVAIDSEDNIIVAGYDSEPGNAQWRVIKLTKDGREKWSYVNNFSDGADVAVSLAIDSRNNIFVAGYEKSMGNDSWRIEKLDPDGKFVYGYRLGVPTGADVVNKIVLDSKDNVIAVGYDFAPGDAQWRIVKLDAEIKKRLWQKNFNPSPGFDELKAVAVDSEDNIIVAGYDSSEGDFRWVVEKLDPTGEKIWSWSQNLSKGADELRALVVDKENNIILGGFDFSLKEHPRWRLIKLSEKKPLKEIVSFSIGEEKDSNDLGNDIVIAKLPSWQIKATPTQIEAFINQNSLSASLKNQGWNHFALTYDGAVQKLYLNGNLVNSQGLSEEIKAGYENIVVGHQFSGLIDEIKIYNRALSASEIKQLYHFALPSK